MEQFLFKHLWFPIQTISEIDWYRTNQTLTAIDRSIIIAEQSITLQNIKNTKPITIKSADIIIIKDCKLDHVELQAKKVIIENSTIETMEFFETKKVVISDSKVFRIQQFSYDKDDQDIPEYFDEETGTEFIQNSTYKFLCSREYRTKFNSTFIAKNSTINFVSRFEGENLELNNCKVGYITAEYTSSWPQFINVILDDNLSVISGIYAQTIQVRGITYHINSEIDTNIEDPDNKYPCYLATEKTKTLNVKHELDIITRVINITDQHLTIDANIEYLTLSISALNELLKMRKITINLLNTPKCNSFSWK